MRKHLLACSCVAFVLSALLFGAASAADHRFIESFNTKQYCDTVNTTALWDTIAGEIKLTPFVPSIIGSYNTAGNARGGIVIEGDYAYVADNTAGLQIVNITNLASPTLAAMYNTPGTARGVFIDGNYAFIADGATGLVIVSVTNPAAPAYVATYDTPGTASDVVVEGNYAFVADYASGLIVVNVTNPASPTLAGSYDTPGNAQGIAIAGNYAYIADGASGLAVINITNPASPTLAGSYDTPGTASDVQLAGDRAYVADGPRGLVVVNIAAPSSPSFISILYTADDALGVAVERDRVYLAASGAMLEIDITDPAAPVAVHSIYTPGTAYGVVYEGVHAFVADDSYGLQIVQMSIPETPFAAGADPTSFFRCEAVTIDGDYAFMAGQAAGGVRVVDITDPANPAHVATYDTPGWVEHIEIAGDYAFVADGSSGVLVLNISNPESPTYVATYATTGNARHIDVVGDYAYVAVWLAGLLVLNVSNPASPTYVSLYDTPFSTYEVVVQGDYAYVLDGQTGLIVLNVSNPASPTHVVTCDTPDLACSIAIHGNYAYVADKAALQILNIINPASPTIVESYAFADYVWDVACAGNYAYVATNDHATAFSVLDISIPDRPTSAGSLALPQEAQDVVIEGDLAFVADYEGGLQIIRIAQRFADLSGNEARSTVVASTAADVTKVKLTTDQIDAIEWELSASNGAGWDVVPPDGAWHPVTTLGTAIIWSSTHTMVEFAVNPSCSRLQIDWLYEAAIIDSIRDIPGDQGGKVRVYFARSGHDFARESPLITTYNVWRRVDGAAMAREAAAAWSAGSAAKEDALPVGAASRGVFGDLPVFKVGERLFMASNPTLEAAGMPSGVWEAMGSFSALQQDQYLFPTTTLADSTVEDGMAYGVFVVTAHTADPTFWYASVPDSGYSLDNLAPHVPTGLAVAYNSGGGNDLSWDACPDFDLEYFKVYRGTSEDFAPGAGNLVETTIDQGWLDTVEQGYLYFYKVSAVDHAGNESAPASAGTVTDAGSPAMPQSFALHQNVPNPFNPTTRIRFDLPEAADVRLAIYDVSGRKIRELASGTMPAGAREVTWDGRDASGRAAASGIYFYRLDAGRFTQTRKMIMLR